MSVGITAMLRVVVAAARLVSMRRPTVATTTASAATPIQRMAFDRRGATPVTAADVAGTALVGIEPPLGVVICIERVHDLARALRPVGGPLLEAAHDERRRAPAAASGAQLRDRLRRLGDVRGEHRLRRASGERRLARRAARTPARRTRRCRRDDRRAGSAAACSGDM